MPWTVRFPSDSWHAIGLPVLCCYFICIPLLKEHAFIIFNVLIDVAQSSLLTLSFKKKFLIFIQLSKVNLVVRQVLCKFFFFFCKRKLLLILLFFLSYFFVVVVCSGFCHTLKWNSHGFTCVPHPDPPSHLPLHPIPLGLPSAPGLSTCLMHPTWAGDLFHPR